MALFFDQEWFNAKLQEASASMADVAASLRITEEEVREIWKDQRELRPNEVTMLARLLGAPLSEVVLRAGVATPTPSSTPAPQQKAQATSDLNEVIGRLEELSARFTKMERAIADLQSLIIATREKG